ncbi:DNA primase [Myceligenerans pegani]|uniref:DNA primase n=1 Tax=Myceligenerans pegani TaxID=2776917 RepID=A0ABR9MTG6_9MICO|nr:DNA primase [Myceligenerans sp. TRM 65318]MBE1874239.1 DNA primase [Myceligenerans sp. TRM 65318]MBE3016510.1 DNA primase [Myceligenerans sp. TRM 65318]
MAGIIRREDVDEVRERARIDEVISAHVTLKPAGVGSLKGLCPFHDERSPSFNVRPSVGRYHCFGCGEGGDVFTFLMKMDGMGFAEAVEHLAAKVGVQLRYEDGGPTRPREEPGKRQRLLDAHRVAQEFYAEQLMTAGAAPARRLLAERSFERADAEHFGVGFAPQGWDNLSRHLQGRGYTRDELITAGLVSQGQRGVYDRFRGRVVWPIRDVTGAVIGFGARKLFDDDNGPKYLNTPETPLYKKSQVLYGIDLAKREIAQKKQVVIVEGYTDVMAAHLSGVTTAVATCGTAFGAEHARVVRRLMGDTAVGGGMQLRSGATLGGKVVFTFDGDEAGQKAAMRAFGEDQRFYAQTFVAVADDGMDPCDLRVAKGPEAVRALVEKPTPLFQFVIETDLKEFDLDTAEGRVGALRKAAPRIAGMRDTALRPEYARMLAGWLGMDERTVAREVKRAASTPAPRDAAPSRPGDASSGRGGSGRGGSGRGQGSGQGGRGHGGPGGPGADDGAGAPGGGTAAAPPSGIPAPDPRDPVARAERLALAVVLQYPQHVPEAFDELGPDAFLTPAWRTVHESVVAAGGAVTGKAVGPAAWVDEVLDRAPETVAPIVTELAVVDLPEDREAAVPGFVEGVIRRLVDMGLNRRIAHARSRLQRLDPAADFDAYQAAFAELTKIEQERRALRETA